MMKKIMAVITAIGALNVFGADVDRLHDFVEAAYAEGTLRTTMVTNQELAVKALFTDAAANRWRTFTEPEFSKEQIQDFFVGALQLRGPVNDKGSIAGFYNPWIDAILVAECSGEQAAVEGHRLQVRKVADFRFLSGESFRGELHLRKPKNNAVLSGEHYLSKNVAELVAKTRTKFEEIYPEDGVPLLDDHPDNDDADNLREIQTRSALRLKMVSALIADKKRYREAWQIAKIMQDGKLGPMNLMFNSEYAKSFNSTFAQLPPVAREGFEPYGFWSANDDSNVRVYLWVNVKHPRLFAVGYLGIGFRKTVFEWFDFRRADEIVKVFEKAAATAKKGSAK